jgi:hypothetical protein
MFSREIKSGSNANQMATSLGTKSKRVEPNLVLFKICAINLLKKNVEYKMEITCIFVLFLLSPF